MQNQYRLTNLLPANELILANEVYLIILHATRIPPHLVVSVNGKIFTLTVKGATIDGELSALLKLIRQKKIETVFIKLTVPEFFTLAQLREEIKKYTLNYPRVDIGIATCLTPIKDFCSSVYATETRGVNFVFDLLPKLDEQHVIDVCYQMNMEKHLLSNSFVIRKYSMNDIFEGIRKVNAEMV